jgi:hypothetical protein
MAPVHGTGPERRKAAAHRQTARLLRDSIDHWIRRYHGYAIEGSIGSHYTEVGVDKANCVFEHVIPAAKVRDMLLQGVLTVKQALNTPTCLISTRNDEILREEGHVSSSPDYWHFFKRYEMFDDAIAEALLHVYGRSNPTQQQEGESPVNDIGSMAAFIYKSVDEIVPYLERRAPTRFEDDLGLDALANTEDMF